MACWEDQERVAQATKKSEKIKIKTRPNGRVCFILQASSEDIRS